MSLYVFKYPDGRLEMIVDVSEEAARKRLKDPEKATLKEVV